MPPSSSPRAARDGNSELLLRIATYAADEPAAKKRTAAGRRGFSFPLLRFRLIGNRTRFTSEAQSAKLQESSWQTIARRLSRPLVGRLDRKFKGYLIIRAKRRKKESPPDYPQKTKRDRERGADGRIADPRRMEII